MQMNAHSRLVAMEGPLVGRADDLAQIAAYLENRQFSGLLVVGVPGAGKSRFGQAALAEAGQHGHATVTVAATTANADVPFGAVAHLLPEPPSGGYASRLDVFRRASHAIRQRARGGRTVVLVDDVHLLDRSSAALLHSVVRSGDVFLIGTAPSRVLIDDSLKSLWRQGQVGRIELNPLPDSAIGQFAEALLEGQVETGTVRLLSRLSGGNPLLLRELLRHGLATSSLRTAGGLWTMSQPPPVSGSLGEALEDFIGAADEQARSAAELVAFGEPLGLELLCRLVPLESVARAERAGLVRMTVDGRRREVRLCHPLTGEMLRAGTAPIRAVAVRRRLAEVLAATDRRRRGDALRLGLWMSDGLVEPAAEPLLAAAREAAAMFDHTLTARFAAAANRVQSTSEAVTLEASAMVWLGRPDAAEERFAQLDEAQLADRGDMAFVRVVNLWLGLHRAAEAEMLLTRMARRTTQPAARAQLAAAHAFGLTTVGNVGRAVAECTKWLPEASTGAARAHLLPVFVDALAHAGQTRSAVRHSEEFAAHWSTVGEEFPYLQDGLTLAHAVALMLDGQFERAETLAVDRYDHAVVVGSDHSRAAWAFIRGRLALFRGRLPDVLRWQREAIVLMSGAMPLSGPRGLLGAYGDLAEVHAIRGEPAAARAVLAESERHPHTGMVVPPTETARAWLAAAEGDRAGAHAILTDIAARSREVGWYGLSFRALHDLARLGRPERVVDELAEQANRLDSAPPARYAAHVRALVDRCPAALTAAGEQFVAAGERLLAAETFAAVAHLHLEAGRHAAATLSAERSRVLYAWCGDVRVPSPMPANSRWSLTLRQRELAGLVAQGHSNRDIADHLSLSVRTVENHLHRVYAKLGVSSRAELAGLTLDAD
jgi:DNA-binding CsgD family transcriptional regulator